MNSYSIKHQYVASGSSRTQNTAHLDNNERRIPYSLDNGERIIAYTLGNDDRLGQQEWPEWLNNESAKDRDFSLRRQHMRVIILTGRGSRLGYLQHEAMS
jgi:hypothetical protein